MDTTAATAAIPYVSPAMVVAVVGTAFSGLASLVMLLGKANFNLRLEAIAKIAADCALQLNNEKSDRERDVRELRARNEELQKQLQTEREGNIRLEGTLKGIQGSLNQQDDVLTDQTARLEHIDRKMDRRLGELDARKESKSGMPATRPLPRNEPPSDPPPMRPRLPSVRRGDGE